jgi:hypothetical protein
MYNPEAPTIATRLNAQLTLLTLHSWSSPKDLEHALMIARHGISPNAQEMLSHMPIVKQNTSVELIVVKDVDLGFKSGLLVGTAEVLQEASKHGLHPCHPQVGPEFRLRHRDQKKYELVTVMMEGLGSCAQKFCIDRPFQTKELWLHGTIDRPNWIITKRRSQLWIFSTVPMSSL